MAAEGSALRSLLAYFKIEVDDKQLKNANNEIDRFTSRLKTLARTAAITFVLVGIKDFIEKYIRVPARGNISEPAHLIDWQWSNVASIKALTDSRKTNVGRNSARAKKIVWRPAPMALMLLILCG